MPWAEFYAVTNAGDCSLVKLRGRRQGPVARGMSQGRKGKRRRRHKCQSGSQATRSCGGAISRKNAAATGGMEGGERSPQQVWVMV